MIVQIIYIRIFYIIKFYNFSDNGLRFQKRKMMFNDAVIFVT
jgi:hypothetical protein